ncbi:MAG: hypothetical protein QM621_00235 [Aeromicrobium sp.]|uniref:hypothetical protein n=1 Tax=Aeromicrobium sp. TaxID=1871063 RepID=UPI0039E5A515
MSGHAGGPEAASALVDQGVDGATRRDAATFLSAVFLLAQLPASEVAPVVVGRLLDRSSRGRRLADGGNLELPSPADVDQTCRLLEESDDPTAVRRLGDGTYEGVLAHLVACIAVAESDRRSQSYG